MAKGRIVEVGRAGARAGARAQRLSRLRGRGGMSAHARSRAKTAAETALAAQFAALGARRRRRVAAFARFAEPGLPTPPRRGLALHRPARRADEPRRRSPPRLTRRASPTARRALAARPRLGADAVRAGRRPFRARSFPTRAPAGVDARRARRARALAERRRRCCALNDAFAPGGFASTSRDGRRVAGRIEIVHSRRPRRRDRLFAHRARLAAEARARPSSSASSARAPARSATPSRLRRSAAGARCEHVGVDRRRRRARISRARSSTLGARARVQRLRASSRAARWCAGRFSPSHRRPGAKIALARPVAARRRAPRRHDARSRATPRRTARAASSSATSSPTTATGVFQGKVIVEPHAQKTDGGMKIAGDPAVADGGDEQQARARNFRRRRRLRPRRDGRRARSRAGVLSGGARHSAAPRPRRCCWRRSASRRSSASPTPEIAEAVLRDGARMARSGGAGDERHPAPAYDVEAIRAEFPILAERPYGKPLVYLDNAASAQKPRAVLDAADAFLRARIRQRASRPALSRQRRDRRLRGRARKRAPLPQRRLGRRDRVRALGDRGDQSGRRRASASTTSARATRSCSSVMEHHANIVPWHFHARAQGRGAEMGRRRRRRLVLARSVRARR